MSDRIFEVDYEPDGKVTFTFQAPKSGPLAETGDHARKAGREMLLTFRSLIDGAISMMDEKEDDSRQQGSIKVE